MAMKTEDPIVSKEDLEKELSNFRMISKNADDSQKGMALAALIVAWLGNSLSLSERQSVRVIAFFSERSKSCLSAVKAEFFEWMKAQK